MQQQQSPAQTKSAILTIPNLLSCFRLLLIPAIIHTFLRRQDPLLTAGLVVLSGLTDLADGFIARRFHMISDLGKILDPIADKLTQVAVLACLTARYPLMLLPLLLLVAKEIAAGIMGMMVIKRTGEVHGADWHGKVSTALLYATMTLHLLWAQIPGNLSHGLILLCTAMILYSCVCYTVRNIRLMKKPSDG